MGARYGKSAKLHTKSMVQHMPREGNNVQPLRDRLAMGGKEGNCQKNDRD
jgi:hypothetical protein